MNYFSTRSGPREDKNLTAYLDSTSPDKWLESCYDAEGPLYWAVLSLLLHPPSRWKCTRLSHLRRLLVLAQARHIQPAGPAASRLTDHTVKDYGVYKSYMIFFGLIDGIYANYFKVRGSVGRCKMVFVNHMYWHYKCFIPTSHSYKLQFP